MLRKFVSSPALATAMCLVVLIVSIVAGGIFWARPFAHSTTYCADLPDAIGLYTGNAVTQRGIPVGRVLSVTPISNGARVTFSVKSEHSLHGDVAATTVADTLAADRRLEVLGGPGSLWPSDRCLTRTSTPKSISRTLDALSGLAEELNGARAPSGTNLGDTVGQLDTATAGLGPQINGTITRLANALKSPEASVKDIGSLIKTMSELSGSIADNWPLIQDMLSGFRPILVLVNQVWDNAIRIVHSLTIVLPWLNDITTTYGEALHEDVLERAVPLLDLVAANVGTLKNLLSMIPVVASSFRESQGPDGRVTTQYSPPHVELPHADADAVCTALNRLRAGSCSSPGGIATTDLVDLVGTMLARGR